MNNNSEFRKIKETLGVDSGSIHFCDVKHLKEYGASCFDDGILLELEKGKYKINIDMSDTWNGSINKSLELSVKTNSEFYLGDLCYCFSQKSDRDDWGFFLDQTNSMQDDRYTYFETGGDGVFDTVVVIQKME